MATIIISGVINNGIVLDKCVSDFISNKDIIVFNAHKLIRIYFIGAELKNKFENNPIVTIIADDTLTIDFIFIIVINHLATANRHVFEY